MILFIMLFQFFTQLAHAEITSEHFVVVGNHNKNMISIREHKVETGKGFSAIRSIEGGRTTGHTLSENRYIELKRDLDKAIKPMKQTDVRRIASCDDEILVGSKARKGPAGLNRVCLSQEAAESRKAMVNWIKKVSRDL